MDRAEKALVEARGVAGAVSGSSDGGGMLTGIGKSDLRLLRRGILNMLLEVASSGAFVMAVN